MMRLFLHTALLTVAMVSAGCTSSRQSLTESRAVTRQPIEERLRASAEYAEFAANRVERLTAAKAGRALAEECVAAHPRQGACYYYRAVLAGLYYQLTVVGYQTGLQQMIADCERLVALDPTFAQAGAYRILGQIFTQVPEIAFRPDSITRDLPRARAYLEQAVHLAPHALENHLALCDTVLALEDWNAALSSCNRAEQLLPSQRMHPAYRAWREQLTQAKKRLAKGHGS